MSPWIIIPAGFLATCGFVGWAIVRGGRLFDEVVAYGIADALDAERAGVFYAGTPETQHDPEQGRGEVGGVISGRLHNDRSQ
jgi:hypothetical protein